MPRLRPARQTAARTLDRQWEAVGRRNPCRPRHSALRHRAGERRGGGASILVERGQPLNGNKPGPGVRQTMRMKTPGPSLVPAKNKVDDGISFGEVEEAAPEGA